MERHFKLRSAQLAVILGLLFALGGTRAAGDEGQDSGAKKAGEAAGTVVRDVKEGAVRAGKAVRDTAKKAGKAVSEAANEGVDAFRRAVNRDEESR